MSKHPRPRSRKVAALRAARPPLPRRKPARIGIVSLGCAKALVDSERLLNRLKAEGYAIAQDYQGADAVIVNTCGFLDSAKAESLEAIGEALAENGRVIVTGCFGAQEEVIRDKYPGVLAITGAAKFDEVLEAVHRAAPPPHGPFMELAPGSGIRLTPRHYAYLKIAEGCDHRCSFCVIPHLRGPQISRTSADVLEEAERLVASGARELLVIAQDSGAYGRDLGHASSLWRGRNVKARLPELARALGSLDAWVRLHYVYPYPLADELIPLMSEGLILPYLDIPFQHASPRVLKAMRRPADQERLLERLSDWRRDCPDLAVRSTFIVGFPGETEEEFEFLLDWLAAAKLDRVGCFTYENVEGAPSNELGDQVPDEEKEIRRERLMELQRAISAGKMADKIGRTLDVLVDEADESGIVARSTADSPEVDGTVLLPPMEDVKPGDKLLAEITASDDYDLEGVVVGRLG
jgi:ribosomal protein S12 methylthiotransferase